MPTSQELLYAPLLKLQRAEDHINNLNTQIIAFLAMKPFQLVLQCRPHAGQAALRTKTKIPIPPEFSAIIGDVVHNLRSALDLTIYQMAVGKAPKPDKIQFPFDWGDSAETFATACKKGQVEFAGKKVVEQIEVLKPSKTGNPVLFSVHALNIHDKHRLLVLTRNIPNFVGGKSANIDAFFAQFGMNISQGATIRLAAPENEDLFTFNCAFEGQTPENDFEQETDLDPTFTISFSDGQPIVKREVVESLIECTKEVRRAVDLLVTAYLDPANI